MYAKKNHRFLIEVYLIDDTNPVGALRVHRFEPHNTKKKYYACHPYSIHISE